MSALQRLQRYLISRRNLVGSALGIGGLAMFFTGIVGGPLGLGVVAALYAIGVLVVPPDRTLSIDLAATQDAERVRDVLRRLVASIQGKVAPDIVAKVISIQNSILTTLDGQGPMEVGDPNVYLIQQTALTYLPQALSSYLAVPRIIAERRPVADGRTPHDVLLEQLDLMDRKLVEVADDLARHDSDRLLANGRFLAERFGSSSLQIGANAANPIPVPAPADAEAVADRTRERVH